MSRLLWPWVLLLATSMILGPLWYQARFCPCNAPASSEMDESQNRAVETPASETPQATIDSAPAISEQPEGIYRFELTDGNSFSVGSIDNFTFPLSSSVPNIPGKMQLALEKIAAYLKSNPTRVLSLTGRYQGNESNDTDLENLGIARATALQKALLQLGVPEGSIQLAYSLADDLNFKDGLTERGVGFEIIRKDVGGETEMDKAKAMEELGERLKKTALKVYFETNSSQIIRTDALDKFLKDAKTYMNAVPEAKLSVTGHTDSDGTDANNQILSLQRANSTKAWLVQNGFGGERISTAGRGESQPVADNNTDTGKKLNRRAEIIIIE